MARTYRLGPGRRAVNSVIAALIRAGVGGSANYLLTTIGRRTGQPRTTPVTLIEHAGERWLVSPYGTVGWVYNVRARPQITLRHGHQTDVVRAEEVPPEVAGPVLKRYLSQVRVTAPYFDARAKDPVTEFVQEARQHPVFRLGDTRPAA
jgi:deazaflavin-dependent oxidoreductase (nitroreductase family)